MKLDEALKLSETGQWQEAQVRMRPGNQSQWFVMLTDNHFKSFVLSDNDDQPIATEEINELADLIRLLGLKEFTVFL